MIDIDKELKVVQIEYIKKELKKLKECYYDSIADYEYDKVCQAYEEQLEQTELQDEKLVIYKLYYVSAMEYLFRNLESDEIPEFASIDEGNEDGNDTLPFD